MFRWVLPNRKDGMPGDRNRELITGGIQFFVGFSFLFLFASYKYYVSLGLPNRKDGRPGDRNKELITGGIQFFFVNF
jgi:hypothetical protein